MAIADSHHPVAGLALRHRPVPESVVASLLFDEGVARSHVLDAAQRSRQTAGANFNFEKQQLVLALQEVLLVTEMNRRDDARAAMSTHFARLFAFGQRRFHESVVATLRIRQRLASWAIWAEEACLRHEAQGRFTAMRRRLDDLLSMKTQERRLAGALLGTPDSMTGTSAFSAFRRSDAERGSLDLPSSDGNDVEYAATTSQRAKRLAETQRVAERLRYLRWERQRGVQAMQLNELLLSHGASRSRLEWQEEEARVELQRLSMAAFPWNR